MNKYLYYKKGKLHFNNKSIEKIIKAKGTPLKMFSPQIAIEQISWLREHIEDGAKIGYAHKANTRLIKYIHEHIDFVTLFDEKVIFQMPKEYRGEKVIIPLPDTKSKSNKDKEIIWIAQTMKEFEYLNETKKRIMLRYDHKIKTSSPFSTHKSGFGMEKEEIIEVVSNYNVEGIHTHLASQTTNKKEWSKYLSKLRKLIKKTGIMRVNIGGGIPYPYNSNIDVMGVMKVINKFIKRLDDVEVWLEPGRFIAAPTKIGVIEVKKVIDKKHNKIGIANASCYNLHPDMLIDNQPHTIMPIKEKQKSHSKNIIRGNTIDSIDIFSTNYNYDIKKGDIIVLADIGAYNYHTTFFELEKVREEKI